MGDYADMAWDPCDPGSWMDIQRPLRKPQPKTCNRCGATGLWWKETERGWRLHSISFEEGFPDYDVHVCQSAGDA